MPRRAKGLSAAGLDHLPAGKHADGGGLYLLVKPDGSRFWLLRYMRGGRARELGLGPYRPPPKRKPSDAVEAADPEPAGRLAPSVGLSDARKRAAEAQRILAAGGDPIDQRREDREAAAKRDAPPPAPVTFRDVAESLILAQSPGWTSPKTLASWRLTLDRHAYPVIGDRPIAQIGREDVVAALSPIWVKQPATARKLQRRISAVLDYAAATGQRAHDNPAAGRALRLTRALPTVPTRGRRQASLPWQRVPALLRVLEAQRGMAPLTLRLIIFTALRSNEARSLRWSDLHFDTGALVIPGDRMKGGLAKELPPHRFPITDGMMSILCEAAGARAEAVVTAKDLPARAALFGNTLIFPTRDGRKPLTAAALEACIQRANEGVPAGKPLPWCDVDGRAATPHGFRRSFRSWVDDRHPAEAEAAERQLAHEVRGTAESAYRGSDVFERRAVLMRRWSEFCLGTAKGSVVTLRRGRA